jgi:hypothetical protein
MGSHDVINNYYGDTGGGSNVGGAATGEEDAESHSDMLRQSSEPVDEGGGDDYRSADLENVGSEDFNSGSNDLFADSGGGDSYDSGGDSGDFV